MKTIDYRITYSGVLGLRGAIYGDPSYEVVSVKARDINSGFPKALKQAREPLGSGARREIVRVELWQVH